MWSIVLNLVYPVFALSYRESQQEQTKMIWQALRLPIILDRRRTVRHVAVELEHVMFNLENNEKLVIPRVSEASLRHS
jgi:hypothetical protein